jgi:hypothetical protein
LPDRDKGLDEAARAVDGMKLAGVFDASTFLHRLATPVVGFVSIRGDQDSLVRDVQAQRLHAGISEVEHVFVFTWAPGSLLERLNSDLADDRDEWLRNVFLAEILRVACCDDFHGGFLSGTVVR